MKAKYTSYVLSARNAYDYFCTIVLLLHAAVAVAHTIYVMIGAETSGTWDSILELITLALNSPPPPNDALRNTSAGYHLSTPYVG